MLKIFDKQVLENGYHSLSSYLEKWESGSPVIKGLNKFLIVNLLRKKKIFDNVKSTDKKNSLDNSIPLTDRRRKKNHFISCFGVFEMQGAF